MLKTETLNIIEFNNGQFKKPVLIRYTIVIHSNEPKPYDEDALNLISFLKSLPEQFETVELVYQVADAKVTNLVRQKIVVKVDENIYSTYVLDDDLDLFFNLLRLFKNYEYDVEGEEQSVNPIRLAVALKNYQI
ncbi:MAG: hypothetical protein HFE53_00075 [Turicibacter sp.]|uniref:Uncharacterized protein n=1 Tax=Turicibacter faecis TaxID=2963365 RepID=A0ABN6Z8N0_9FIRM|nr:MULTISPECIES: hypothetical protein [unclassified Turicibacter]MCI8700680.1 hypothetical protein [Turicibacter sp.]BEH90158.1 hypothetical protein T23_02600 [Turicibacter sp. TC023]MCU7204676.1 hypothetical protein [Turicibacter sp. TA25]MCU7208545.1 hypothetical protein [Turicibacter sp. 1E2]NCE78343.1 hypothetical protein [Turicibacter sp. TS3]